MSLKSWGSKICTSFCQCEGICLLTFPTKIAEHCLLFIAQPCVISQPSFPESLWFFSFLLILIHFCLINTLFIFCIIFLWFSLALIWREKAFCCSNTFSLWHGKDCQMRSPCLVDHETYLFSRARLKRDLRMNFERTMCDKIHFPCMFWFSWQFLYWSKSLPVCFLSRFSLNFEWGKLSPWPFF